MPSTKIENTDIKRLTDLVRRLEGVTFAGDLGGAGLVASCSCQNCGCDSRAGGSCGCNERCSCQGHTANHLDNAINVMLGAAAHVPLERFKELVNLRDEIKASLTKEPPK